ncbi:MAG TPA: CHC2 zinc finger domain-containing protein [Fibrobacteria bacterium]|nr:CHC2 zinc finger domain-containing protein [Fibrobacteria bacterium]
MDATNTRTRGRLRRDRIDIPAFLKSEGFTWKGPGPWVDLGLCPFHKDHRPSLRGNLETGRVRCMACGWSGDPVAFTMQRHGLTFGQAARRLGAWEELPDDGIRPFRRAGEALGRGRR